jgi:RNA polymerase sigma-70 factor (ECF subfamily)
MQRDEILTRIRERVLAFAASRLSRDAAEDVAQEVLIVLHDKYKQVEDLSDLLPLSFQILRFKMLDAQRKAMRRGEYNQEALEDVPLPDPGEKPDAAAERMERFRRLQTALDQLSPRCRQLFRWKLEGKPFSEIRGLLAVDSINTVYTWDSRCRKQLLALMGGSWE